MMNERSLDLETVQVFLFVADLGSFTRAAEALQTTQSAVSLKLKKLEERLGCRLVDRSPRYVQLSAEGASFLPKARSLMQAHDRALTVLRPKKTRLVVGISDHVAGPELPILLAQLKQQMKALLLEVRIGSSGDLLHAYDRRELDAVFSRFAIGREEGEVIAEEKFGWFAGPDWTHISGEPLPVATMPEPCGVRSLASDSLQEAGLEWEEVFVGGGVSAVTAAVMSGLGVAALARRMLPLGAMDVGDKLGLPALPILPITLYSRVKDPAAVAGMRMLAAAFRNAVQ
ncbi:MAG: LysR family transcriptional regulator [Sneathiellales bacterium]|nr:LysR family transcriptional regulator [Sneathiellales bacterium]